MHVFIVISYLLSNYWYSTIASQWCITFYRRRQIKPVLHFGRFAAATTFSHPNPHSNISCYNNGAIIFTSQCNIFSGTQAKSVHTDELKIEYLHLAALLFCNKNLRAFVNHRVHMLLLFTEFFIYIIVLSSLD